MRLAVSSDLINEQPGAARIAGMIEAFRAVVDIELGDITEEEQDDEHTE